MDILRVNEGLRRGINMVQATVLEGLMDVFFGEDEDAEFEADVAKLEGFLGIEDGGEGDAQVEQHYVGVGGTEPPDHAPMGDPEEGGSGGVENVSHEEEMFLSYLSDLAHDASGIEGCSEDDAYKYLMDLAKDLADSGELPDLPEPEVASAEEFSAWTGAAKTVGLGKRLSEYVKEKMAA